MCFKSRNTFPAANFSSIDFELSLELWQILNDFGKFDNGEYCNRFVCSDEDFDIALSLVKVYQEHAVFMFRKLPKQVSVTIKVMRTFFNALPDNFQRFVALSIGNEHFNIKPRTIDLYLSMLYNSKWLDKPKAGFYKKLKR